MINETIRELLIVTKASIEAHFMEEKQNKEVKPKAKPAYDPVADLLEGYPTALAFHRANPINIPQEILKHPKLLPLYLCIAHFPALIVVHQWSLREAIFIYNLLVAYAEDEQLSTHPVIMTRLLSDILSPSKPTNP